MLKTHWSYQLYNAGLFSSALNLRGPLLRFSKIRNPYSHHHMLLRGIALSNEQFSVTTENNLIHFLMRDRKRERNLCKMFMSKCVWKNRLRFDFILKIKFFM
ncbi:hypothetical protein CHS0354_036812 [Potamilus streckersoni]|uniref:Uncharacterized protein n=1 Tax=Potamilus streckersoni TaxID=2493646 RepID=A0AAE0SJM1_9BIVA|nr:hypothetical protein CHS0354_036812 [Potamilus streckersoni]